MITVDSYIAVPRPTTLASRTALLHEARAIMRAEYAEDLTLDDVATRIATSRRQLQRVFRELGGTGFREELAAIRMRQAAELLHGSLPIGEVCRRVGYRQSAQFAKAFRAHHGVLPSVYRERLRTRVPPRA